MNSYTQPSTLLGRRIEPLGWIGYDRSRSCLTAGLRGMQAGAFAFQGLPQSLDKDVIHPAVTTMGYHL